MRLPPLRFSFIPPLGFTTKAITKKSVAVAAAVLFLGIVASFGYIFYQERQAVAHVRPALKLSSIYISDLLESGRPPSDMPAEDYFKKNETAIAEIEKKIAEIRSLAEAGHKTIYYEAVKYMQLSEAVIQEFSNLYQHVLLIDAARAKSNNAKASLKNARNIHDANYRRKNFLESLNESAEELQATSRSRQKIIYLLMQMQLHQAALEKAVGTQSFVNDTVIAKAIIKLSIAKPASGMSSQ